MRRQKNISQIKEQNKASEKKLNIVETNNLLDAEFKTLVISILNELKGRADELSENKEIRNIKMEIENTKKEPVTNETYIN